MTVPLQCYRCGASLGALSLPLSREDQCPSCAVYVHCCRMCEFYDPAIAEQCREDDADEVKNKEYSNFCDYFQPVPGQYDATYSQGDRSARAQLDALFNADDTDSDTPSPDSSRNAADDLFK